MSQEDLLDSLLSAVEDLQEPQQRVLTEADLFGDETPSVSPTVSTNEPKLKLSAIHNGDTDSSDDEDNKYHEDRKYTDYGKEIKDLLQSTPSSSTFSKKDTWKSKQIPVLALKELKKPAEKIQTVETDPVFGLRIINPLVSSTTLQERMVGRETVPFSRIRHFVTRNLAETNWVIGGVLVGISNVKTSQKGTQFLIWTLSDLKDDIKTVSMFLFGSAYKQFWKSTFGTVVGILNPSIFDNKEGSKDEACISVDNAQKIMILGTSKDAGTCKSKTKSGANCTSIVNKTKCEYCLYHIKQEYQKCSKRSELQSSFAGKGLTALRNKVLGKNEVFYAGKSFMAIPAKRNAKQERVDDNRLKALNSSDNILPRTIKAPVLQKNRAAANLEISKAQRLKDLELLNKLKGPESKSEFSGTPSKEVTFESSKSTALSVIAKLKAKEGTLVENTPKVAKETMKPPTATSSKVAMDIPLLGKGKESGFIDLSPNITPKHVNRAKLNALKYIQRNGAIKKIDPNSISSGKKRPIDNGESSQKDAKRSKIEESEFFSDRFKKMMQATSKHMDLLEQHDNDEADKYFNKLEMKEKLEEKMVNTFKVPCKAVKCLTCKYTNFSASQSCKDLKHPLKVYDAVKRFFKCGNCGNRTVSLNVIPTEACTNCGSGKWERTGMMKEKTAVVAHNLSIRGGEQKFVNSVANDSNLNLMVPDE